MFFVLIAIVRCQYSSLEIFPQTNTIGLSTGYDMKFLLSTAMPIGTNVVINLAGSNIGMPSSVITCLSLNVFNPSVTITYTSCTCSGQTCTIVTQSAFANGAFVWLRLGNFTNPNFVQSQTLTLTTLGLTTSTLVDVYQPGVLSLQKLTQSSFKVNAANNLEIQVQTLNAVPTGGQISLTFPSQIGYTSISVIININGGANSTGTLTQSGASILVSGAMNQIVASGGFINIYILGTQNQQSVRNSNSITLSTATSAGYIVDSLQLSVQTTIPETIASASITPSVPVNTAATLQITVSPTLPFINGGYMKITFPPQLTLSGIKCTIILGLTIYTGNTYSCTQNGQVVQTVNLQYPNTNNAMILVIAGITTPSTMKPTDSFQFATYDVDSYLICQSSLSFTYTASYGPLVASLIRSVTTVSAQTSLTLQITTTDNTLNGFYYVNIGTQLIQSTTSITCSQTCTFNNNIIKIAAVGNQITITGLFNPNYVITTQSDIEVYTSDPNGFGIDQMLNVPITPTLTPMALSGFQYSRNSTTMQIGSYATVNIQFQVTSPYVITNNGNLIINLNGYYFNLQNEALSCYQQLNGVLTAVTCQIQTYLNTYFIQNIKISGVCPTGVCSSPIQIQLSTMHVDLTVGSETQTVGVQINTVNDQVVGAASLVVTVQNTAQASSDITVTPGQQTTGLLTSQQIAVAIHQPLLGSLVMNSISASTCTAISGTSSLTCIIQNSVLTLTSSLNPISIIGQTVTITFQQQNPPSTAPYTWSLQQMYQSKAIVTYTLSQSVTIPAQSQITILRSPNIVNQNAQFNVNIILTNNIAIAIHSVVIPSDQIIVTNLQVMKGTNMIASTFNNAILTFTDSSCPCTSSQQLVYTISGFTNPATVKPLTSQIVWSILDSNAYVYETATITLIALNQGSLKINSISQTGTQLQSPTIISIQFTAYTQFNQLQLSFNGYQGTPSLSINGTTIACTIQNGILICNTIQLAGVLLITLSASTVTWIAPTCTYSLSTFTNTYAVESILNQDCSALTNLPIKSFSSTALRNESTTNSAIILTITLSQPSYYVYIQLPKSDVQMNTAPITNLLTSSSDSLNLYYTLHSTAVISSITMTLMNANAIYTTQSQYLIKLSLDNSIFSYQSTGLITPILQCIGSSCGTMQLSNYIKSSNIISAQTDITLTISLPFAQSKLTSFLITFSQTSIQTNTTCAIGSTAINCNLICSTCTQTSITLKMINLINSDDFNNIEKVCVTVASINENINACQTFPLTYGAIIAITKIVNSSFQFNSNTASSIINLTFNSQLKSNTYLIVKESSLNFSSASVQFDGVTSPFTYANQILNITICQTGCTILSHTLSLTNIITAEIQPQNITMIQLYRNQGLDTYVGNVFPQLTANSLTLTAQAINLLQLNYNITTTTSYSPTAFIILSFNNSCTAQQLINTLPMNVSCNLLYAQIINAQISHNGLITQSSSMNILLNPTIACPAGLILYQNTCISTCPSGTYGSTCTSCIANCNQCTDSINCITCNSNYQLLNGTCTFICPSNCASCTSQTCSSCVSPYVLYQNQCKGVNDCTLSNCDTCQLPALQCVSCSNSYKLYNGACVQSCPEQYYVQQNVCQQCPSSCQQCSSATSCSACITPYILSNGSCNCAIKNCITCSNTACLKCSNLLYQNSCVDACPDEYYASNHVCISCTSPCKTCDANGCLSCLTNYTLNNFKCELPICTSNCQECNSSACITCTSNYTLQNGVCIIVSDQLDFNQIPPTITYTLVLISGLAYLIASLVKMVSTPLIPQIILSSIIVFSVVQQFGNIIIFISAYIVQDQLVFTLAVAQFTSLALSMPNLVVTQPFLSFITSGQWFRAPLTKLLFVNTHNDHKKYTNYLMVRHAKQIDYIVILIIQFIATIGLIILSPFQYVSALHLVVNVILLTAAGLEIKLI